MDVQGWLILGGILVLAEVVGIAGFLLHRWLLIRPRVIWTENSLTAEELDEIFGPDLGIGDRFLTKPVGTSRKC